VRTAFRGSDTHGTSLRAPYSHGAWPTGPRDRAFLPPRSRTVHPPTHSHDAYRHNSSSNNSCHGAHQILQRCIPADQPIIRVGPQPPPGGAAYVHDACLCLRHHSTWLYARPPRSYSPPGPLVSSNSLPVILFHMAMTSVIAVSKCDVGSKDSEMKTFSFAPSETGAYVSYTS